MTNHLQISDGIDEEDQRNQNVTDTIMIPEISDNISDISSISGFLEFLISINRELKFSK